VLDRAGVLFLEVGDRGEDLAALFQEAGAEMLGVDLSVHLPRPSRRSASMESMPASSTILSRPGRPETSVTLRSGRSSGWVSSRTTASLALPSSGGAATRTFQPSPWRPTIAFERAPGETRRRKRVEAPAMWPV